MSQQPQKGSKLLSLLEGVKEVKQSKGGAFFNKLPDSIINHQRNKNNSVGKSFGRKKASEQDSMSKLGTRRENSYSVTNKSVEGKNEKNYNSKLNSPSRDRGFASPNNRVQFEDFQEADAVQ